MLKDREWIAAHIPHQGSMCLLDGVLDFDATHIRCVSRAHRDPRNPLRAHDRLAAVCGIEFAAQAAAVHGALLQAESGVAARAGFLVALRGMQLHVGRLDDIEEDLLACAKRTGGDDTTVLYELRLTAGGRELLAGRATIVINPAALGAGSGTEGR
jgi:predicted hotdog family 3-hydroxylacyl-ACP dehydratase